MQTETRGEGGWEEIEVPGEDDSVHRDLERHGLPTVAVMHAAIRAGQTAGDFCTPAHPVFYPGGKVYGETNGELRSSLMLLSPPWTLDNEINVPRIVSPDKRVALTAVAGNEETGLIKGSVTTRRPRGSGGRRLLRRNPQYIMAALLPKSDPELGEVKAAPAAPMWYLLYFRDGSKVRCEVSLAFGVSESGALIKWSERIILPEIDLMEVIRVVPNADGAVDVDVHVERIADAT